MNSRLQLGQDQLETIPLLLLAALQLVLLQPLLQQLLPTLSQDWPAELEGLILVELALVQPDHEILESSGEV